MTIPFWGYPDISDDLSNNGIVNPWEVVYFANVPAPGIASVRSRRAHRHDVRVSPGDSGVQISNLGPVPAEVDITLRIWTAAQWQRWQDMHGLIFKKLVKVPAAPQPPSQPTATGWRDNTTLLPDQAAAAQQNEQAAAARYAAAQAAWRQAVDQIEKQQAIAVYHPALEVYGIHSLYCLEIGVPEFHDTPGVATIALKFVEFRAERGGSFTAPSQAEVDIVKNTNHTNDYSGTTNPTAAPSTTQAGP